MGEVNVLEILEKINKNIFSQKELNSLIQYSYKIASVYLKSSIARKQLPASIDIQSLDDLAIDSIVPLFVVNNAGILGILRSYNNWKDPIATELDAEYFLSKIIWKRTSQTITSHLKEKDPVFKKIITNLNLCIFSNDLYKKRFFGTVYIAKSKNECDFSNVPPMEFFDSIPEHIYRKKQMDLFNTIFNYITDNSGYNPIIPLNQLVKKVKAAYFANFRESTGNVTVQDDEFVYLSLLENEINNINERLETFYVPNHKITEEEAVFVKKSFEDITADLLNGGLSSSLFEYLRHRNSAVTSEIFYEKYHHIMNYLLKNLKTNLANQLD